MAKPCHNPRDAALAVVHTLRAAGHTAYLAGGCVRDALLGLDPKDYDVATDAAPDRVQSFFRSTAAVGAAFGVVLVYIQKLGRGRHTIEVATFRAEGTYSDGRRPDEVRFTTAEEDAKRRDFTINGLFADPPPEGDDGADTIIDFVGGHDDLNAGVIRAIGDPIARFGEDYLRMLRAVRFASRLGFEIEPHTADAIKQHAPKLDQIARERIGDEVRRMMMMPPPAPTVATDLLDQLHLTLVVLGTQRDPKAASILRRLSAEADYSTRLLAWVCELDGPISAPPISTLREKLVLSNDEYDAAEKTCRLQRQIMSDKHWMQSPVAVRKRWACDPRFTQSMLLMDADWPSSTDAIHENVEKLASDGVGLAPTPLVTGDDLIASGLTPGPNFKTILDQTYDAQLEGRVTTRDEALSHARSIGNSPHAEG